MSARRSINISTSVVLVVAIAGCNNASRTASQVAGNATKAVSPLIGSWRINGADPPPKTNLPQFVRLTFKTDGTLEASYVAAGGALAAISGTNPKRRTEHDSYSLDGNDRLRVIEGSRALSFTYAVRDGKLFLTGKGDDTETVYQPER